MTRPPRVLFLPLEYDVWRRARHNSYLINFGVEEGLRAAGVECVTRLSVFLPNLSAMYRRGEFDQVWVELVHNPLRPQVLEHIAELAPVRVGLIAESLTYHEHEIAEERWHGGRVAQITNQLPYLTHILAMDEADVDQLNATSRVRALWWPHAVPERLVAAAAPAPIVPRAAFTGALYGVREAWLAKGLGEGWLTRVEGGDGLVPRMFDGVQLLTRAARRVGLEHGAAAAGAYMTIMRTLRRRVFSRWLRALSRYAALVNLPHYFKTYPGRVWEGIAAGRPVVSWAVPDRPRTRALFDDGREIALYDNLDGLRAAAERLAGDRSAAETQALNARRRMLAHHTAERRAAEVLRWLETGHEPSYG